MARSSRKDLRGFPPEVRRDIGHALYAAQQGQIDPSAKPLRGFGGASMLEIVAHHEGDTWRTVYTVRWAEAIYVLNAFQKRFPVESSVNSPWGKYPSFPPVKL